MFLGEAPRNVREKRRGGEEKTASVIASLLCFLLAPIAGTAPTALLLAFVRLE